MSMGCNVEIRRTKKHVKLKTKCENLKTIFDGEKNVMKRISYSTIIIIRNCINYSDETAEV